MSFVNFYYVKSQHLRPVERSFLKDPTLPLPSEYASRVEGAKFNIEVLNALISHYLERFPSEAPDGTKDAWLAPRLHAVLRLPRRIAARPEVWAWCALGPMRSYMQNRWPLASDESNRTAWRYFGNNIWRNGVARLWWASEILRNGPDYGLIEDALGEVYRFQYVSELRYSWHKEFARAFSRVLRDCSMDGTGAKELSKRINVYLKLRALEADDTYDPAARASIDAGWLASSPSISSIVGELKALRGPEDGYSRQSVESSLYDWIFGVARELELRGA